MNFITFGVTTLLSPVFSKYFGTTLSTTATKALHFQYAGLFWIAGITLAIFISFMLKETGRNGESKQLEV